MLLKDTLPTSIEALQKLCLQQQLTIDEKTQALSDSEQRLKNKDIYIEQLEEKLSLLLSQRYQSRSEQLNHLQAQLFDESELEQAIEDVRTALDNAKGSLPTDKSIPDTKPKKIAKRESLPTHLRRVEIVRDVSDDDKQMMGDDWTGRLRDIRTTGSEATRVLR